MIPHFLKEGYKEFLKKDFLKNSDTHHALATYGASPKTMIITCADSRIDPNAIFSSIAGDLFILRNVANIIPPFETAGKYHGVSAALEYAVIHLKVSSLIIMGHSQCAGIRKSFETKEASEDYSFLFHWLSLLDEIKQELLLVEDATHNAHVMLPLFEKKAIAHSLSRLRSFAFIQEAEEKKTLSLHGLYYDISKGELLELNEDKQEFSPVLER